MTVTPDDQPSLWLKQVPNNQIHSAGVWDVKLLENHHAVARTRTRPRDEVDAVTLSQLRRAVSEFLQSPHDKDDPRVSALHRANAAFDTREQKEQEGKV